MRTLYILTKSRDKLKLPFSMQLKGQNIMPVTWELPLWELCIFLQNLETNQNYPSPCNWTDKTSCLLHGSCHYEKLVYSYKIYRQIKTTCITLVSQNIGSTNEIILLSTSQREIRQSFLTSSGVERNRMFISSLIGVF